MKSIRFAMLLTIIISMVVGACLPMKKSRGDIYFTTTVTTEETSQKTVFSSDALANQPWAFEPLPVQAKNNFFNKVLSENVLVDPGYWTWGLSTIKWTDGKYHAFYSRWKYEYGFKSWLTDCEIAHAVADNPEGPYQFVNVVLESRKVRGWESATAHNPYVCVVDDTIFLYYISVNLDGVYKETETTYPVSDWIKDNWDIARNRQMIGLATATEPSGLFTRISEPVIKPYDGPFKNIAVNPAVTFVDGEFTMIIKGDDVKRDGIYRIQLSGKSNLAKGPFVFDEKPVYDNAQTEDAAVWYNKRMARYYMVCHVLGKPELIYLTSKNGRQWVIPENPLFIKKEIPLENGEIWKPERMERPFVFTDEQGNPMILFVAVKDRGISGNIALRIKGN